MSFFVREKVNLCVNSQKTADKNWDNAVIYMQYTEQLSKTKLLKLLFLMEEYMVKRYHVPFMGLPFEIWQAGPVAKDIFIDLSDGPFLLKDFVKTEVQKDATYIRAIKPFCDDEFSDCEMEMMDEIIRKYGKKTAKQLVAEVHKEGSLWFNAAKKHGLLTAFNKGLCNNSDYTIDFSEELSDCAREDYKESLAIHQTANILKAQGYV